MWADGRYSINTGSKGPLPLAVNGQAAKATKTMTNKNQNLKQGKSRIPYLAIIIITAIITIYLSLIVSWKTEEDYYTVVFWGLSSLSLLYLVIDFLFLDKLRGWKKILFVACSVILILTGTEYFTRTFMKLFPRMYKPSPSLIWKNTPNLNAIEDQQQDFTVSTDHNGFRNYPASLKKPKDQFRIMVVGDSTAFGWPLGDRENFSWYLEKNLRTNFPGKDFRVINAAVCGYSSLQGKRLLDERGWDFKPDLLIIAFNNDTFIDIAQDKDRLPSSKNLNLRKIMYKCSIYTSLKRLLFHSRINPEDDLIIPPEKGILRVSPEQLKEIYETVITEAQKRNIKTITVSLPLRGMARKFPGVEKYRQIMKTTSKNKGALFLNLLEEWNNKLSNNLFFDDIHPNKKGHEIIAERLSEIILNNSIPENPETTALNEGFTLFHKGEYPQAEAQFKKAVKINPLAYKAWYGLGKVSYKTGKNDSALINYNKALKLNPNDPHLLNDLGAVWHYRQNFDKAIPYFKKAVTINPMFYPAYDNLGFAYYYMEKYDKALDCFNKSIEANPYFADSYLGRGKVYMEKGEQEKALKNLTKAISLDKNLADAYYARGLTYADSLQYNKALADLNKAAEFNPDEPVIFFERSFTHYWNGNFEKALKDIKTALNKIKTDFNEEIIETGLIYMLRGLVKLKMNNEKEGKKDIINGMNLFLKKEICVNYTLPGHAALYLKQNKKALDYFNKEPKHAKHKYYGRAKAYMALNQKDKALKDLKKALEILPESWEKKEAAKLLQTCTNPLKH